MSSGTRELSPLLEELRDQCVDLMKVATIQGLAARRAPDVFELAREESSGGPAGLGSILADFIGESHLESGKGGVDSAIDDALGQLYDTSARQLVRRYNVDLEVATPVLDQVDRAERFGFVAELLADDARLEGIGIDTFDTRFEGDDEAFRPPASFAMASGTAMSPIIRKMIADLTPSIRSSAIKVPNKALKVAPKKSPTVTHNKGLEFRVHEVRCIDETNPEWFGSDKIGMGAVMSAQDGESTKVKEFNVGGGFDDGDRKLYSPPRILHRFKIDDLTYPANFVAFIALAEKRSGGLSKFLNRLWKAVKDEVDKIIIAVAAAIGLKIGAGIGGTLGTTLAGPLGTAIGAVAGAVLGALAGWLISKMKDKIFQPQEAALQLPGPTSYFAGGSRTSSTQSLFFRGYGGKYRVYYSWKITR